MADKKYSEFRCPGKCKGCKRENLCNEPFKYTYGDIKPGPCEMCSGTGRYAIEITSSDSNELELVEINCICAKE